MSGRLKTYAFINAKLRTRISSLLSDSFIKSLARAKTLAETVIMLQGTPYSALDAIYRQTGDLRMCELELIKSEVSLHIEVVKYVSGRERSLVQALLIRFEIENLKNAVRLWFDKAIRRRTISGQAAYLLTEPILHDLRIDNLLGAENKDELLTVLTGTPYRAILERTYDAVAQKETLFPFEIALDRFFFKNLQSAIDGLEERDAEIARRMVGVEIDLHNINWLVRFKEYYNLEIKEVIDYTIPSGFNLDADRLRESYAGKDPSQMAAEIIREKYPAFSPMLAAKGGEQSARLVLLERLLEQIMLYEVRRALGGYPFTIGIILSYFILKQHEIRTVMAVLNAQFYEIKEERILNLI